MEEEREPHGGVTMKSSRNAVNPLMSASQDIAINEEMNASSSSARKRTRDEASEKMRVEEIQRERNRRDKMAELYSTLRSMFPHLFPKVTRERIVDETISYIRKLERDLKSLQEQKAEAIYLRTHQKSSMEVTVSGNVALFGIRATMKQHNLVMERIFRVFEEQKAEVLAAGITVKDQTLTITITALLKTNEEGDGDYEINAERIKRHLTHTFNLLNSEF
ncbi:transcription factor bHLH71-like [Macadamia integrifolia]|uniref:transcription factor bHLH71-like n=1 Tax=Macadamia integrifolia TaxID=60698 RepID=UPI001C5304A2|nr:transcription factor bHLH71-like [Macadamia integrifolia]